jgi:TetR/AcrR family transcriptional regulator, cholesterol catabolism regulator
MAASKAAKGTEPRERRNRELEVIAAAIDLFWRKGYASTSVQDVADAVGVLKGGLYYYIDSKEGLLFRIFEESHAQATELMAEAEALDAPPLEQLHHYFRRYVQWYLENVERVSLYSSEARHLTGERAEAIAEQRRVYDEFARVRIQAAKDAGLTSPTLDVRYATAFIWGSVNSLSSWYRPNRRTTPKSVAAHYAAMITSVVTGEPLHDPKA